MWASLHGHEEIVRTLLEYGANVNAETKVSNQNDDDECNNSSNCHDEDDDDDNDDVGDDDDDDHDNDDAIDDYIVNCLLSYVISYL